MKPKRDPRHGRNRFSVGDDPVVRRVHSSWHRGPNCNFIPSKVNFREQGAIEKYILPGWVPEQPLIPANGNILAVGSCFAQHIVAHLRRSRGSLTINKGNNVNIFAFGAGFVNTFTLRQQFEWALGDKEIEKATLFVENPDHPHAKAGVFRSLLLPTDDKTRNASRKAIEAADAYILTLGLSEIWYHKESGEAFFGAIPEESYNPKTHGFRVSSVEENYDNILALYNLLRELKPEATIVFTLSPVRLTATFRPVSCLTANSVSKSILRAAVDRLMRTVDDPRLVYWPSFEIVTEFYGQGGYLEDLRHVRPDVIDTIMHLFEKHVIEGTPRRKTRSPRRRAQARKAK